MASEASIYLFCGRPAAGKSHLSRQLCLSSGQDTHYVLNNTANSGEYKEQFQPIDFDQLDGISHASLIVEDIIRISEANLTKLFHVINNFSRKRSIFPIILITHGLIGDKLFSLPRAVSYIVYFTGVHTSNIKYVLQNSGLSSPEEVRGHIKNFVSVTEKHSFFIYNCVTGSFTRSTMKELTSTVQKATKKAKNKSEERGLMLQERGFGGTTLEAAIKKAEQLLDLSPSPSEAKLLFGMIFRRFSDQIDLVDYTLPLVRKEQPDASVSFSLIDLCSVACDPRPNSPLVTPRLMEFFRFLAQNVTPPRLIIKNPEMKAYIG